MRILISKQKISSQCKTLLYILIATLVFEGIARKLLHPLSILIFFIKDIVCIISVFLIRDVRLPSSILHLKSIWQNLFLLFIPLLFFTGFKDPILALFAFKQYLLYAIVGALVVMAFPLEELEAFQKFLFFAVLLLVPTTMTALLQNSLPASHWLNASVDGDSLEAFSAVGYLRVGSTFSFTGQYSWFLNAESFLLATSFFLPPTFSSRIGKILKPFIYSTLLLMLAVSAFVTGGRTAVLGCGATLALGTILISIRRPQWIMSKGALIIIAAVLGLSSLRAAKPEFFMAYDARSADKEGYTHNQEVAGRVADSLFDWTSWFWDQDIASITLGNGLGVMSNGSEKISGYAARIKIHGTWTENDVPTTFWEGGMYLAVIWYGFRLFLILLCYRVWYAIKENTLASAASVPLAYVTMSGSVGQLSMQPPLSIWLWLAIGIIFFLYNLYYYQSIKSKAIKAN